MKKFLAAIVLTVLFAFPSYAMDFEGVGVGMGVYVPMGDASDYLDVGYSMNGHADFGLVPMLDLRLFADYNKADGDKNGRDYDFKSYGGGAMLMFYPEIPLINVYAGLGYGIYSNEISVSGAGYSNNYDRWGHGPKAQAGLDFNVLLVNVGLNATYFMNMVNDNDIGNNMGGFSVGLSAGLSF